LHNYRLSYLDRDYIVNINIKQSDATISNGFSKHLSGLLLFCARQIEKDVILIRISFFCVLFEKKSVVSTKKALKSDVLKTKQDLYQKNGLIFQKIKIFFPCFLTSDEPVCHPAENIDS
jgi:hypothetical protein